jgi:hypothetical protein
MEKKEEGDRDGFALPSSCLSWLGFTALFIA